MGKRRFLGVAACFSVAVAFPPKLYPAMAATYNTSDAKIMASIAKDMCARPSEYGFTTTQRGAVTGQVNTGKLLRKFGNAGIKIEQGTTTSRHGGVPATDLAAALANANSCVQSVFRELSRSYRVENPAPATKPNPPKPTRRSQGTPGPLPKPEPAFALWTSPLPPIGTAKRQEALRLLAEGKDAEKVGSNTRAQKLYTAACDDGEGEACQLLGRMIEEGRGSALDASASYRAYDRGCQIGDALACYGAGIAIENGWVTVASPGLRLRAYYKRSCDMGNSLHNAVGCAGVGTVAAKGIEGSTDIIAARQAFEKSCTIGFAVGCHSLAMLMTGGLGGDRDIARARSIEQKACKIGYQVACDALPGFPTE